MAPGVLLSGTSTPIPRQNNNALNDDYITNAADVNIPSSDLGAKLDASTLQVTLTPSPKIVPAAEDLAFGKHVTDHMLQIRWTEKAGWHAPQIMPYAPLSLDPAACVFNYGFECFEGMKAYKDSAGKVRLFRPLDNLKRFNESARRIALPGFDAEELLKLVAKFVEVEERWIYQLPTHTLYLRPVLIGTSASLGVTAPTEALLYLIASPVGSYFSAPAPSAPRTSPDNLPTTTPSTPQSALKKRQTPGILLKSLNPYHHARAFRGGAGCHKIGGNYAPCIRVERDAKKHGFQQVLWTTPGVEDEEFVGEAGTMNVFVVLRHRGRLEWRGEQEETEVFELVPPPLDGTILPGITRSCVLELAKSKNSKMPYVKVNSAWRVSERQISMAEMASAAAKGDLIEVFGTGTAAVVTGIRGIEWRGEMISCGEQGEVTQLMKSWIEDVQYGRAEESGWSVGAEESRWSVKAEDLLVH
ncbi:hypothetical protein GQ43DRAFT_457636 [Delitschia confertaspora ATCC 74209]|uniref:Branched-chain-amino-acid aminotransferase n=1 Tax=Delitschia confertaspora ATCC 74209 TaxID=1513339 RepID=A0A9P4JKD4_9PLEO|nr:hypothetical protein GQ43DRAFT_457636 [Delitschia confertaspora ATCC 74209]